MQRAGFLFKIDLGEPCLTPLWAAMYCLYNLTQLQNSQISGNLPELSIRKCGFTHLLNSTEGLAITSSHFNVLDSIIFIIILSNQVIIVLCKRCSD
jgi:hypothetical protein